MEKQNKSNTNPENPQTQELLDILKGLPTEAQNAILNVARQQATRIKQEAEQQAKLERAKDSITKAITPIAAEVPNFDVRVRNGAVEVKLVGVARTPGQPKTTGTGTITSPLRDSGFGSGRELMEQFYPEALEAYLNETDKNKKHQYLIEARRRQIKSQAGGQSS